MSELSRTSELYKSFEIAFNHFNKYLFGGKLPPVIFTVREARGAMAYYCSRRFINDKDQSEADEIALNLRLIGNSNILTFLQTLTHEMAHAYQSHYGTPSKRSYHNLEFSIVMESVGLVTSHNGRVGGRRTGERMGDYPLNGGPFIYACLKLLQEDNFKLTWLDKYQMRCADTYQNKELLSLLTPSEGYERVQVDGLDIHPDVYTIEPDQSLIASITADADKSNEFIVQITDDDDDDDWRDEQEESDEVDGEDDGGSYSNTVLSNASMDTAVALAARLLEAPSQSQNWSFEESNAVRSKVMFMCPVCCCKAWGKPSLKLGCLTCKVEMRSKEV